MITKLSVRLRPRMWVSGSTSSRSRSKTSSITSGPMIDSRASMTAAAHGRIFSLSLPGQVAELLAADRVDRPEHHDPLVACAARARPPGRRPSARTLLPVPALPPRRHDADLGVGQQVDGDALLGRAAPHVEHGGGRSARGARACRRAPGPAPTASRRGARGRCGRAGRGPRRGRRRAPRTARRCSARRRRARRSRSSWCRRPARCGTPRRPGRRCSPSGAAAGPW